ncbi:MAG: TrpB-like pyridoxal phosphate-dependent enzyme [Caldisericum sp.]|jgi:tryptophan synthase beta chain|nr:TrpB-like pyridoxal phosphate-dependent enzyme [Caldisericum sp.]
MKKVVVSEEELPKYWYNVLPDLPEPVPLPLDPVTNEPVKPEQLEAIFPKESVEQEMAFERFIEIPEEVRNVYATWRPTPLVRAENLERAIGTKAKIFYKNESVSPPGSHKPNTAVAQAYYAKKEGVKNLVTETGAGQWGSALSFAGAQFGLQVKVYMVKASYEQKPYRRLLMEAWGGKCYASPTEMTEVGRKIREQFPDTTGSLGIAISEAVEDALTHKDTKYAIGSVLNHVLLHQTVIGLETKMQLQKIGVKPTIMIGCVGGGSNFGGFMLPFLEDKLEGNNIRFIAVEPTACPTFTRGKYRYDYGDTGKVTPLLKMFTLGSSFIPSPIHAGGLRYHGDSPILSLLLKHQLIEAQAYFQREVFEAGILFARTEGILPAPETNYAIKATIEEAKKATKDDVIVFNFSGHGHFDLAAYDAFFQNKLQDYEYPEEEIEKAMRELPNV